MAAVALHVAICRECVGEPEPAPACWRCRGAVVYRVASVHEADFTLDLAREGVTIGLAMRPTERFQAWLREVDGAE